MPKQHTVDCSISETDRTGLRLEDREYILPVSHCSKSGTGWVYHSSIALNPLSINGCVGGGKADITIEPHGKTATLYWNDGSTSEHKEFAFIKGVEIEEVFEYPRILVEGDTGF